MKGYMFSFDFKGSAQADSEAAGILNRYNCIRIKPDVWFIYTDSPINEITGQLADIAEHYYYFAAEICGGPAMLQPEPVNAWFRRNVR